MWRVIGKKQITMIETREMWRPVVGYEGSYEVSSLGKIKSLERLISNGKGCYTKKESITNGSIEKKGYRVVRLYLNGISKDFKVHRLVAEAFIANPENKPQVNHINGVKNDNRVENLEWATQSENILHADKIGLRIMKNGEYHGMSKLKKEQVLEIYYHKGKGAEIARVFGISNTHVGRIKNKQSWACLNLKN